MASIAETSSLAVVALMIAIKPLVASIITVGRNALQATGLRKILLLFVPGGFINPCKLLCRIHSV
jgi:hypothetical protein